MRAITKAVTAGLILNLGFFGGKCSGTEMRAFSLREANRLAVSGVQAEGLQRIGGISRFCGMVFDRETGDVILVGRTRTDLPAATLDDVVTALRARLLKAQYPRVSIDMVEATPKTGVQNVRFDGGIQGTKFGADFLESDVILKRYSLELLGKIKGIEPYSKLYEQRTRSRLAEQGHQVEHVDWLSEKESKDAIQKKLGKKAAERTTVQSRFWFHVKDDESFIVEKDDIYVIEELRLGVKAETMLHEGVDVSERKEQQGGDQLAAEFARQFSAHYQAACNEHPLLKRLKVLFDLVCIAEGIAHVGTERPNLDYLLNRYQVNAVNTPEHYPLLQRVGEFRSKGDACVLVQLSGGIDLEAILLALEDGDVGALKLAVLKSRPSPDALCWDLPLDDWKMPNDEPAADHGRQPGPKKIKPRDIGFGLTMQEFLFDPERSGTHNFTGFALLPAMKFSPTPVPQYQKLDRIRVSSRRAADEVTSEVQAALLKEDWGKVAELIGGLSEKTSPVMSFIKAHARLALNENNDSLLLFLRSTGAADIEAWLQWSKAFKEANRSVPIAYYFHSDSMARAGKYEDALRVLEQGLSLDPEHALLLNASGVLYAKLNRPILARSAFNEAIVASKGHLADAYNNLGAAWIQSQEGAEGAELAFVKALELTSGSAVSAHGLLCTRLVLGKSEGMEELIAQSALLPELQDVMGANVRAFIEAAAKARGVTVFHNDVPGTTLKRTYDGGPGDNLRSKLESSFQNQTKVAQAGLPQFMKDVYGKYQENVRGQVVADFAQRYGVPATAQILDKMDIGQQKALQPSLAKFSDRAARLGGLTKGVGLLDSVAAGSGAGALTKSKEAAALAGGVTKMYFDTAAARFKNTASLVLDVSRSMKAQFGPGIAPPAIPEPANYNGSRTYPGQGPGQGPGGADSSMAKVRWDDGKWPFRPLYGLGYGLGVPAEIGQLDSKPSKKN